MADFIIITILAIIVFFIVRSQLRRMRKGECAGGCAGCTGCAGCAGCSHCQSACGTENPATKAQ